MVARQFYLDPFLNASQNTEILFPSAGEQANKNRISFQIVVDERNDFPNLGIEHAASLTARGCIDSIPRGAPLIHSLHKLSSFSSLERPVPALMLRF